MSPEATDEPLIPPLLPVGAPDSGLLGERRAARATCGGMSGRPRRRRSCSVRGPNSTPESDVAVDPDAGGSALSGEDAVAAASVATVASKVAGLFSPRREPRPVTDGPAGCRRPRRRLRLRRTGFGPPRPDAGSSGCGRGGGVSAVLGTPVASVVGVRGTGAADRAPPSAAMAAMPTSIRRAPGTCVVGVDGTEATAPPHARRSAKAMAVAVDDARRTAAATASARCWAACVSFPGPSRCFTGGLGTGGVVKVSAALETTLLRASPPRQQPPAPHCVPADGVMGLLSTNTEHRPGDVARAIHQTG